MDGLRGSSRLGAVSKFTSWAALLHAHSACRLLMSYWYYFFIFLQGVLYIARFRPSPVSGRPALHSVSLSLPTWVVGFALLGPLLFTCSVPAVKWKFKNYVWMIITCFMHGMATGMLLNDITKTELRMLRAYGLRVNRSNSFKVTYINILQNVSY